MRTYVLRRLLGAIPLLLVISVICFSLMRLAEASGYNAINSRLLESRTAVAKMDAPVN